jgi:DNA-binding NarL/FixJ family response regulator
MENAGRTPGSDRHGLTSHELLALELIAEGLSEAEVAAELGIDADSARALVARAAEKMSASSPSDAAVRALRAGLIGPMSAAGPEEA